MDEQQLAEYRAEFRLVCYPLCDQIAAARGLDEAQFPLLRSELSEQVIQLLAAEYALAGHRTLPEGGIPVAEFRQALEDRLHRRDVYEKRAERALPSDRTGDKLMQDVLRMVDYPYEDYLATLPPDHPERRFYNHK